MKLNEIRFQIYPKVHNKQLPDYKVRDLETGGKCRCSSESTRAVIANVAVGPINRNSVQKVGGDSILVRRQ